MNKSFNDLSLWFRFFLDERSTDDGDDDDDGEAQKKRDRVNCWCNNDQQFSGADTTFTTGKSALIHNN